MKRIGIFGGSFDPIHNGHLEIARSALSHASLDSLLFVPAKKNPLKHSAPVASDEARVEMLNRAIVSDNRFSVSPVELNRPTPSYTVETIRSLRKDSPPDTLWYLIIGGDSAESFFSWRDPHTILEMIEKLIIYPRRGASIPWELESKAIVLPSPLLNISSTEWRAERRQDLLSPDVASFIRINKLYT